MVLFDEVDSTNTAALAAIGRGVEDGTVFLAEGMTAGRGRLGRVWYSPSGVNIYCTVVLRPGIPPARLPLITLMAAVATVQAIRESTGLAATIKWPNDIMVKGKKAGGILTESVIERDSVRGVALGIGLNVNMTRQAMPAVLRRTATSLRQVSGHVHDRTVLLRRLLQALDHWYGRLTSPAPGNVAGDGILQAWRRWTETLGRRVKVMTPRRTVTGLAHSVTAEGALILRLHNGTEEIVTAGDVVHLRPGETHAARD